MHRPIVLLLCLMLLTGCAAPTVQTKQTIYEASFLSLFDTVTVVKGPAESKEKYDKLRADLKAEISVIFYSTPLDAARKAGAEKVLEKNRAVEEKYNV